MDEQDPREYIRPEATTPPAAAGEHQSFASVSRSDHATNRAFAVEAAQLLSDNKCSDVIVIDVTTVSQMTDYIVIATGTSDRQMRSVGDELEELVEERGGSTRKSSDNASTWIVLDFIDVVVHLFEPNTRAYYDLEMLWGDGKRLDWQRPS